MNSTDDIFGLGLERGDTAVELQLGLVTPGVVDATLLEVVEAVYREVADAANHAVLFTENENDDDPSSPEVRPAFALGLFFSFSLPMNLASLAEMFRCTVQP